MAGIYIHIPFCKQACSYCDFHFSTKLSNKTEVLQSMLLELHSRSAYLKGRTIDTIYFGGGTPSMLNQEEIESFLGEIAKLHTIANEVEISLEANPDDLNNEKLQEIKQSGINRLSIGVQSFFDVDLQFMNRAHQSEEAITSIKKAQDEGFENITIDLIFGAPTTSDMMWDHNLQTFFDLGIPHLSAYSLTVEEKTLLAHQIKKGQLEPLDDEKNYRHYMQLQFAIQQHAFEQYELSNYCRDELYSKHNKSYWEGTPYMGIGPSAHSYNGRNRQWNVNNNSQYVRAIKEDIPYFELEKLSEEDRYHEFLITHLRTKWGIRFEDLWNEYSESIIAHFEKRLPGLDHNLLTLTPTSLQIKKEHLFQSDKVVRRLMF